ncbi:DNA repair protein endonuclease SAE2/CtIP C-terminus-domain-containing protein [Mycena maculata]|uniref:DNA repair protein endonuclease SAE2/CtIP C-terminus-domain-containing protein n=1 Tax=Mycena maculata TaxID=230809 RepID=A0AAD7IQM1_9AGAR|nr:DNA repair protein endonuclease SAE2/CtIP C-terminus-domain-containing protein [Mycena maculata]
MPSGHPHSGKELRTRDKAVAEKHQQEIRALQAKAERIRHAFDDRAEALHSYQKFGDDVANRLGFRTLEDVKTFIDIADEQLPYKGLADRVERLKAELAVEKQENQSSTDELLELREERDLLKTTLENQSVRPSDPTAQALAKELVKLQTEYNALHAKGSRAEAKYREDFAKWKAFKRWMANSEAEFQKRSKASGGTVKRRHREALHFKGRQKLKQMGLDSDDEPVNSLEETPVQMIKLRSNLPPAFSSSPTMVASSTTPAQKTPAVSSARVPLEFKSIRVSRPSNGSSPIRSAAPVKSSEAIDLSDTEDDSQEIVSSAVRPIAEHPRQTDVFSDHRSTTSKTTQRPQLPALHPTLPSRPDFPALGGGEKPKKQRHSDTFPSAGLRHARPDNDNNDEERPRKTRRFSPVRTPLTALSPTRARSSMNGASISTSQGRENRKPVRRQVNKRGENPPASTPANNSGNKQLTDYSAFKGRGRYGKAGGNDTINASYAIDPARNGGMDFQYDTVVRGKEDRRRMDGGDCECCRDYYEAIGPLPNRLQPPLWRSPPNSPEKGKPCRHNAERGREEAITSHKQAISRHRHNWARASTPPSYWNIGFPDTQEAERINAQAETMHEQKRRAIQAEAENGGRYYKTR